MKVKKSRVFLSTALLAVLSAFSASGIAAQSVEERLTRLEQMAETRGQLQADIMFQINAIQQELQKLRGQIEQHEYQLKQLQERQRDLYSDIERRLAKLQNSGSAANDSSGSSTATTSTLPSTASNTGSSNQAGGDVHSDYQQIFAKVRNKQYDQAIADYQSFLSRYPKSQYEASVHYWLGQIYYIQNKLDLALASYQTVTKQFGNSSRAADALLKQGKVLVMQNKINEAKAIFNQVIERYDGTTEQLARNELQKLK
ncbi:tol-pal system protein YbgF [Pleionea litopenaei]|uniref:Cell division coordinator CpoB n=1 Tax=Pleionea litopenaei TaxID=3070815 RepID=A0AA51RW40_9GAMM|nr:tol-pal system protein YbgF [Pleionea sp. HL-JVS1]WMS88866.1 tol-pal system protein YbgF [Pleionea sp. HL-JVS1]